MSARCCYNVQRDDNDDQETKKMEEAERRKEKRRNGNGKDGARRTGRSRISLDYARTCSDEL